MFTKAAHIKPSNTKAHHPAFNKVQQSDSFIPSVQPKLEVDSSSSSYEVEADQMADHVVSDSDSAQPTNFVSSAPVQTESEGGDAYANVEDPAKLADDFMPPKPGEDPSIKNENAQPAQNVEEEKIEKEKPETVEETVKEPKKKEGAGGKKGMPAPKEEEIAGQGEKGEDVSAEESAAFMGEPNLEPAAPIEITPELTAQLVQPKLDEKSQDEEENEIKEESGSDQIQTKTFDTAHNGSDDNRIQRSGNGGAEVRPETESGIAASKTGGQSMDGHTQQFMESQFQADFSDVKIHTDSESAGLNNQLQAKAFTHENHVYFNEGQYDPGSKDGQHLVAHELTHVVQQNPSVQRKPQISNNSTAKVQRLGISDALDYFADKANYIPGFRMFTIILGLNPINMSSVDRSAANIMRAMVEFLPGGGLITDALDNHGVFDKASVWFKEQMDTLSITGSSMRDAVNDFLDSLGWSDIFDLGGVWDRAKRIFTTPIKRIISFAKELVSTIIDMVKEAILRPLAGLAAETPAYDLLRVVYGSDPITGDPFPPTPENLIGGFMKLIGQEEIWNNIQEGNAIEKAYAWFQDALSGLMEFVTAIPVTVVDTLKSLTWTDIVLLPKAFVKVGKVFLNVAGKFLDWAGGTVLSLLEIIFTVVAPGAIPWIKKTKDGFDKIISDPIGFIGNLITAAKDGFLKFSENIGKHLKNALINWLTGSLAGAGIYIPTGLDFMEIMKFVLSVLGVSWAKIRIKLVKHLGETAVKALETGFELVMLLVTKGPMAMWERIMEHINDLKTMVVSEITSWVVTQVVKKAIAKLVTSLNPAGAVIQAIIMVYDTITFLTENIKKIFDVGVAVLDSITDIANGVLSAAIKKVEDTLAKILVVAVKFFAHFAGLGGVSKKIVEIITKLQEKVDAAIDKVIDWLVKTAKKFLASLMGKKKEEEEEGDEQNDDDLEIGKTVPFEAEDGSHKIYIDTKGEGVDVIMESTPDKLSGKIKKWEAQSKNVTDKEKQKSIDALIVSIQAKYKSIKDKGGKVEDKLEQAYKDAGKDLSAAEAEDKVVETEEDKLVEDIKSVIKLLQDTFDISPKIKKYIDKRVTTLDGDRFLAEFKNAIEGDEVYFIPGSELIIKRKPGTADFAPQLSVDFSKEGEKGGILVEGKAGSNSSSEHTNYVPDEIKVTESGGVYLTEYKTKTFNGDPGPTFKIETPFEDITEAVPDKPFTIKVEGKDLVLKATGGERGTTDSATQGFHNAHLIADRFGGSGKNQGENIWPSSPKYNTKTMKDKEDTIAKAIKADDELKKKFNMTVTATISDDVDTSGVLKNVLESEFNKDNANIDEIAANIKSDLVDSIEHRIRKDLKALPGRFMGVSYNVAGGGSPIGEDVGYADLIKKFVETNVNNEGEVIKKS